MKSHKIIIGSVASSSLCFFSQSHSE